MSEIANGHLKSWIVPAMVSAAITIGSGFVLWGKQEAMITNLRETDLEVRRELSDLHKEQADQDKLIGILRADLDNLKERVTGCEKRIQ